MKVKRRLGDQDASTSKKSKAAEECPPRNPARTRLDDLTNLELAGLISTPHTEEVPIFLHHPRVRDYPYYGNLIAYLHGQVTAIQDLNIYKSDRFNGLTNLLSNISSLFNSDAFRGLERLPHILHADQELNRRLVAMIVEYFLKELPEENDGSSNADTSAEVNAAEHKLESNIGNLLTVIHNYHVFELKLPDDQRYFNQALFKCEALKVFVGRSLDVVDVPVPVAKATNDNSPTTAVLKRSRHNHRLYSKLLEVWVPLLTCPEHKKASRALRDQFVRHRNIPTILHQAVTRMAKRDRCADLSLRLFNALLRSSKLLDQLGSKAELETVRAGLIREALSEFSKLKGTHDGRTLLILHMFTQVLLIEETRDCVLCGDVTNRALFLDGVQALMAAYLRLCPSEDPQATTRNEPAPPAASPPRPPADPAPPLPAQPPPAGSPGQGSAGAAGAEGDVCEDPAAATVRPADGCEGGPAAAGGDESAPAAAQNSDASGEGSGEDGAAGGGSSTNASGGDARQRQRRGGGGPGRCEEPPVGLIEDEAACAPPPPAAAAAAETPAGVPPAGGGEDEERRRMQMEYAVVLFRIYARLARGDPRVLASVLFQKFGGSSTGRERLLVHLQLVQHSPLRAARLAGPGSSSAGRADAAAYSGIVQALEDPECLQAYLRPGSEARSNKEMRQALTALQDREMNIAEEKLNIKEHGAMEKGLSLVRNGQCVLVEGEQTFDLQQQHIDWMRRTGGGNEPCPFVMLRRNQYLHRKYKVLDPDQVEVCTCLYRPGMARGCEDSCSLRLTRVECTPGLCPCGEACCNQRFQRCQYAPIRVGKAPQDRGWGLFAAGRIPQGTFVIEYMGEVVNRKLYERRKRQYEVERHTYFMALSAEPFEMIDASRKSSLGRFINHSCEPNCETVKWISLGEVVVGIFAMRDIQEGDEITFDYRMTDGSIGKACRCGAASCRGSLGASDGKDKDAAGPPE